MKQKSEVETFTTVHLSFLPMGGQVWLLEEFSAS
jgi:hypothetical protein